MPLPFGVAAFVVHGQDNADQLVRAEPVDSGGTAA